MFTWNWIFEIVLLGLAGSAQSWNPLNPYGYTCEEFERDAYFDPYRTLDSLWKIFYFWGNTSEIYPIIFSLPAKERLERFRLVVDSIEPEFASQVQWRHAALIMEPRPGVKILLMDQGSKGAFRALIKKEQRSPVRPNPMPQLWLADIRLKMVGRYIGMMCCEDMSMYAMSRLYEVPTTEEKCEKEAAKLGFPMGGGRSHLYLSNLAQQEIKDEL